MFFLCGCNNTQTESNSSSLLNEKVNGEEPILSFDQNNVELGSINKKEIESLTTAFGFTNKGIKPLVIKKVDVSCGCTKVDYVKSPIKGGQKSEIKVTLDFKNMTGYFHKKVYVISNAEDEYEELSIKGSIIEDI